VGTYSAKVVTASASLPMVVSDENFLSTRNESVRGPHFAMKNDEFFLRVNLSKPLLFLSVR